MNRINKPEFHAAKRGYDMREVDDCIDTLLTQSETLERINNELFQLWLSELPKLNESVTEYIVSDYELSTLNSLLEISLEHNPQRETPPPVVTEVIEKTSPPKKRSRFLSAVASILFYCTLVLAVFGAFLFSGSPTKPPQNVAGFSAMTVLTRSMQSVLPQHSLIVTRKVDPNTLQVGDDISFLMPSNISVTHRIIDIEENYQNTRMRGFQTQGVENANPDTEIVLAQNVIGRVVFHNLILGQGISLIRENILIVGIGFGALMLMVILIRSLRTVFSKGNGTSPDAPSHIA